MIALGASTLTFHNFGLEEALARIRRLGFDGTDIGMMPGFVDHFDVLGARPEDRTRLLQVVRESGLAITTLNVGQGSAAFNDPAAWEVQAQLTKEALKLGRELGCYAITVQAGVRMEAGEWLESARFGASRITPLADVAEEIGVQLTLESPHMGSITETKQQVLDYLEMIGDPRIGVTVDTSHVQVFCGDVPDYIRAVGDRIGHVHLRDARASDILVRPGQGEIDFGAVMRQLEAVGYSKVATFELEYPTALSAEELEEELRQSRAHLEAVYAPGP